MSTKLTLSIEEEIIQEAKEYAKSQGRSLSKIVSEYLKSLASKSSNKQDKELSKTVKELKGSIKLDNLNKSYDSILEEALLEKYLK